MEPTAPDSLRAAREQAEAAYLQQVLATNGWNVAKTARVVGIHRLTLHQKMRRYGLHRPGRETSI